MILKKMSREEAQELYNKSIAESDRLKENGEHSSLLHNIIGELEFFYGCKKIESGGINSIEVVNNEHYR